MNTCIYILIDPRNNLIEYVGKTNTPFKRYQSHIYEKGHTAKIHWIKKLLSLNLKPEMVIVDEVPLDEWRFWETYWYDQIKSWGFKLKNSDPPGNGATILTKEQRKERSDRMKGRTFKEIYGEERAIEIGKKISQSNVNKSIKEKIQREQKRKNSFNQNVNIEEWKQKLSDSHKGKTISAETKKKISIGIKQSETFKQSMINRKDSGVNNPRYAGKIYQYTKDKSELVRSWEGLHELKEAGYNLGNISSCIKGKLNTASGYWWTRIDF